MDAFAGQGRPLRRRRETVPIYGRQRLRGTAALQETGGRPETAIPGRAKAGRPDLRAGRGPGRRPVASCETAN
jgi:hypothetical protein